MQEHDVVGIGNAIVDIIGRCDDAFLGRHGRVKGSMQLVDGATVASLYDAMGPGVEISGGSVANTAVGVASFGGRAGFIGKVADDEFGRVFAHDIRTAGVTFTTPPAAKGGERTARTCGRARRCAPPAGPSRRCPAPRRRVRARPRRCGSDLWMLMTLACSFMSSSGVTGSEGCAIRRVAFPCPTFRMIPRASSLLRAG